MGGLAKDKSTDSIKFLTLSPLHSLARKDAFPPFSEAIRWQGQANRLPQLPMEILIIRETADQMETGEPASFALKIERAAG